MPEVPTRRVSIEHENAKYKILKNKSGYEIVTINGSPFLIKSIIPHQYQMFNIGDIVDCYNDVGKDMVANGWGELVQGKINHIYRPRAYEKWLQFLYGKCYYWISGTRVEPIIFKPWCRYIEATDYGGGYYKNYVDRKLLQYEPPEDLAKFSAKLKQFSSKYDAVSSYGFTIPKCILWS
jgi:hypothetical protein